MARHGERDPDLLRLLSGHRVKGESELLLPLLSLPVTVSWTNSESIRSHVTGGTGFSEQEGS